MKDAGCVCRGVVVVVREVVMASAASGTDTKPVIPSYNRRWMHPSMG